MKFKNVLMGTFLATASLAMACPDHEGCDGDEKSEVKSAKADAVKTSTGPWIRPGNKGKNTAAYISGKVDGVSSADILLSAECKACKTVELHDHINEKGVMKMRPVKSISQDESKGFELQPGGKHIMLMGLEQDLKEGEKLSLTLNFKDAGSKQMEFTVQKPKV